MTARKPCAACADVAEWKALGVDDYYCRKHEGHPWERKAEETPLDGC
tara:strand:- start:726 stop:866 length:141 start_codon:yes stop_codon:yes gene_type:complete